MSSCEVSFETIVTRGPALTDESMQSFKVIAFLDDEDSTPFMNHQDVTLSDGVYKYSPIKYWPNDGTVSFFAYSASTDYGTMSAPVFEKDGSNFKATFEYELPETDGVADAASQPDLVFAQKSRCSREDGTVSFAFSTVSFTAVSVSSAFAQFWVFVPFVISAFEFFPISFDSLPESYTLNPNTLTTI